MNDSISTEQLAALIALDANRVKRDGRGYAVQLQAFIQHMQHSEVQPDYSALRAKQAQTLWDVGVGKELGFTSFEAFLDTIPKVPESLRDQRAYFSLLTLVPAGITLGRLCALANVFLEVPESDIEPYYEECRESREHIWIRVQDGVKYRSVQFGSKYAFSEHQKGLTAYRGVCVLLQHPECIGDLARNDGSPHLMILPGSSGTRTSSGSPWIRRSRGQLSIGCDSHKPFGGRSMSDCD